MPTEHHDSLLQTLLLRSLNAPRSLTRAARGLSFREAAHQHFVMGSASLNIQCTHSVALYEYILCLLRITQLSWLGSLGSLRHKGV